MRTVPAFAVMCALLAILPAVLAAPDPRFLIVRGASIGPVRLDMTYEQAYNAMVRTWPGILVKHIEGPKNTPPCLPTAVNCTPTRAIWVTAAAGVLSFDTYGRIVPSGVFKIAAFDERYATAAGLRRGVSKARAITIMGTPMKSVSDMLWWKLWWGMEFPPAFLCWPGLCVSLEDSTVSSVIVYD